MRRLIRSTSSWLFAAGFLVGTAGVVALQPAQASEIAAAAPAR